MSMIFVEMKAVFRKSFLRRVRYFLIIPEKQVKESGSVSMDKVKAYLRGFGVQDRIMEFDVSSATVELAARAIGCEPERIAKTLSFSTGENCLLIVAAGDARVDNSRYKERFGSRARMLRPEQTLEKVGHAVGGVCPFDVKQGVPVYLDISLKRFSTVFPACGSSNSAIEMSLPELELCTKHAGWVDVCKDWQK